MLPSSRAACRENIAIQRHARGGAGVSHKNALAEASAILNQAVSSLSERIDQNVQSVGELWQRREFFFASFAAALRELCG
jgi:hypothetical protein